MSLKVAIKRGMFRTLRLLGRHKSALRGRAVVLMYHGFTDNPDAGAPDNRAGKHLYVETFRRQLEFLKREHTILPLSEIAACLREGRPLPDGAVAITIDDGYESNYRFAYPLLQEFDAPATIYITTNLPEKGEALWTDRIEYALREAPAGARVVEVGGERLSLHLDGVEQRGLAEKQVKKAIKAMRQEGRDVAVSMVEAAVGAKLGGDVSQWPEIYTPLSWAHAKEMAGSGLVDLGSHTLSHVIVARCGPELMRRELGESRDLIRERTGVECASFCYPNGQPGDYSDVSQSLVKSIGYTDALTTVPSQTASTDSVYAIPRVYVDNREDLPAFQFGLYSARNFGAFLKQCFLG